MEGRPLAWTAHIAWVSILGLLLAFSPAGSAVTPASALTIEIGISSAKAKRRLLSLGYSDIQIYDKSFKTIRARGCKDGILYNLYVNMEMQVGVISEAGRCQDEISIDEARAYLNEIGLSRVDIFEQNGLYVALACRGTQRLRVTMDTRGKIIQQRGIGQCENFLQPNDIAVLLREQGYNRINFTDRQLPWYVAEACRDSSRVELRLDRRGRIRDEKRIGRCAAPINPDQIAAVLESKGFDRVSIIDDELPRYVAEACRGDASIEISLNRFGTITNEVEIGQCQSELSREQIIGLLAREGFKRIQVEDLGNGGFRLSACLEGREKLVRLTRYGEIIRERDGKACEARSLEQITNELADRGLRDFRYFIEACRKKRRIRFEFDAFGDQIGRERIGSC